MHEGKATLTSKPLRIPSRIDVPISLPSSGAVCLDYPFSGDTGSGISLSLNPLVSVEVVPMWQGGY